MTASDDKEEGRVKGWLDEGERVWEIHK